jgi:hypothetical protein
MTVVDIPLTQRSLVLKQVDTDALDAIEREVLDFFATGFSTRSTKAPSIRTRRWQTSRGAASPLSSTATCRGGS